MFAYLKKLIANAFCLAAGDTPPPPPVGVTVPPKPGSTDFNKATRKDSGPPHGKPGAKLARKAAAGRVGLTH